VGRARHEKVRLQAAQMFGQGVQPVQVAHRLRVSAKSARQWRLSTGQPERLRAALDGGPATWEWD
jgi:putative transposase